MKMKNLLSGLVISGLLAGLAQGATFRYRLSGDWADITDGASSGWGLNPNNSGAPGTVLPGGSDDARVNWGGNTITVTTAVPTVNRVQIGVDESGTVVVNNGGALTTSTAGGNGDILVGNNNAAATGTLTVNNGGTVSVGRILWAANGSSTGVMDINGGGVVNVASHLWWGTTGTATISISGTLNQTGGILGLGTSNASTPSGGSAMVSILSGGVMALNNISGAVGTPSIQPGSNIEISGTGQLTVNGDQVGNLGDYIAAGKITGSGGAALDVSFDGGITTVSIIPEPSVAGLLGVVCIAGFLRRRRTS